MITAIAFIAIAVVGFLIGQWSGKNPGALLAAVSGVSERLKRLFQRGGEQ